MYLRCGYWNNSVNVPLVTLLVRHAYGPRSVSGIKNVGFEFNGIMYSFCNYQADCSEV